MLNKNGRSSIYPVAGIHYFPTGIDAIDGHLKGGGLWEKEIAFLCGRPGIGKTAVAVDIATNLGWACSKVAYIDLTESPETMAYFAHETEEDAEYHLDSVTLQYVCPGKISAIRSSIVESDADVVIIDYAQLIDLENFETLEEALRSLPSSKAYLVLSQISRDASSRETHFPEISDLLSVNGNYLPCATIMLYRDSYYEGTSAEEMEAFIYRGDTIVGHGHWLWTPKEYIEPYMKSLKEGKI